MSVIKLCTCIIFDLGLCIKQSKNTTVWQFGEHVHMQPHTADTTDYSCMHSER